MKKLKNFINGHWFDPADAQYIDVENPSTGEIIAQVPLTGKDDTILAIEAAHSAFQSWRYVPVAKRTNYLFRLLALLEADEQIITGILVEEMGKSIPDAQAELKRMFENIETACGMPVLQQGDKIVGCSADMDGEVIRLPLGVFAMIAPFNFPAMVPFWFLPYSLASGNCFIVKASIQAPITMNYIAGLIEKTGLPPGVFTLLNGHKITADALIEHPLVKGISLVGSTSTCIEVSKKCSALGKRFQAMGGAKNHLVVMPDARIADTIRNMITSCYGCAGQRCMAASVIVCVTDATYDTVVNEFIEASGKVITTNPLDPAVADEQMVMGPVISAKSRTFILEMIETGIKEGAQLLLDGRGLKVPGYEKGHFIGATIFGNVKPGMTIHKTEIFGPVVCMMKVQTFDEALTIINEHYYGNGASIYTQNGYYARRFKIEAEAGMIGINVGIPAPVAYLPFGGMKNSQFADIKAQGKEVIKFFTEDKIITERYWNEG